LREREIFTEENYDTLKAALRERLRGHGYWHAKVEGRVEVDPEAQAALVVLMVDTGDQLRVGRLFVGGAQAVSRDRIVLASGLKPGDLVTPEALQNAQRHIQALGIFTLVQVEPAAPESPGRVPVVVTDIPTAELVKVAANSFLATKISFINAMAEVCEAIGGDVLDLAQALSHDAAAAAAKRGTMGGMAGGAQRRMACTACNLLHLMSASAATGWRQWRRRA
jgi:hypothetical protein